MRKQYILPLLTISAMAGLALTNVSSLELSQRAFIAEYKNASGAPAGRTGAPGEQTCTACHAGTAQNGDAITTLTLRNAQGNVVTSYMPDSTYDANFIIDNAAVKKGFQIVALVDDNNTQAGNMIATAQTTVLTQSGRKYVTHKSSSNTTTTGWSFKWKAPSSNVGDVRFYAASNVSNNNGSDSGDQIFLSQDVVSYNPTASVKDLSQQMNFSAFFAAQTGTLNLSFDSRISGEGFVNLVDLGGKSVFNNHFGAVKIGSNQEKVLLPAELGNGIYIAHLFVNNQSVTCKLMIQR